MNSEKKMPHGQARAWAGALAVVAGMAASWARAEPVYWIGGEGNWQVGAWSSSTPYIGSDTFIDAFGGQPGIVRVPLYTSGTTDGLTIGAGGTLITNSLVDVYKGFSSIGRVDITGSASNLRLWGDASFGGMGTTTLSGGARLSGLGATTLIGSGHTLASSGPANVELYVTNLVNQGTVIASGGWMQHRGTAVSNSGVVRIENGGTFSTNSPLDNTGALVDIQSGTLMLDYGGSLTGGTVRGHGAASVINGYLLRDTTLEGELRVYSVVLGGRIVNNSVLTLAPYMEGGSSPSVGTLSGLVIDGTGEVRVEGPVAEIYGVTFGRQQTFSGSAVIRGALVNHGTINVTGQYGLSVDGAQPVANDGVIRVAAGSYLQLGRTDNDGGLIDFEAGARFSGWVAGGVVRARGEASIGYGTTFENLSLEGAWNVDYPGALSVLGRLQIDGSLSVGKGGIAHSYSTRVYLRGDATLDGAGRTVLYSNLFSNGEIALGYDASPLSRLTIGSQHTLTGHGIVTTLATNRGQILTEAGGGLQFDAGLRNEGVVRIAGGYLSAQAIDNRGGRIEIGSIGQLSVYAGRVDGGVIHGDGGALRIYDLHDVTLTGTLAAGNGQVEGDGESLGISGTLSNQGVLKLGGTAGRMRVRAAATLAGVGRTELGSTDADAPAIVGGTGTPSQLTIAAGHTVAGSGGIYGVALTNKGTLDVRGSGIHLGWNGTLDNQGLVKIAGGGELAATAAIRQSGEAARTFIDGRLRAPSFELLGGLLSGRGVLAGDLQAGAGTVRSGSLSGVLTIEGDYTAGEGATLVAELDGIDGRALKVDGDAALGGLLQLEFGAGAQVGDSFEVLAADGVLSGRFSGVSILGTELAVSVSYLAHGVKVTLTTAVPEPATAWLLLAGLTAAGTARKLRLLPRA